MSTTTTRPPKTAADDSAAVPPGYKRTEVGVIPEEWKTLTIFKLAGESKSRLDDGDWVEAEFLTESGVRLLQTGNIGVGEFVDKDAKKYISDASFDILRCKDVEPGDLLICRLADPAGRACIVPNLGESRLITAVDVTIFRPLPEVAEATYLLHVFSTPWWFAEVSDRCGGSTRSRIARGQLAKIAVPLPPLPEQRAIAEALSDVDGLLRCLEALIAKKRAIKQAAMQQLLAAKTRLPGFSGPWETKRLGEIAHIKTGSRNNEDKVADGQYPFFVRSEHVERINTYTHDCEAILVPGEGRIGEIFHYVEERFDVHQRVYAITRFTPEVSGRFLYFHMAMRFGAWAMQNTVKATVDSLRLPTFQNFTMEIPPTIDEQTSIAAVLSDMDAEIAALERRREKTRAIKQGMMQQLLTGRVRLVDPSQAEVTTC
jgi:type I restriction enzyme S subunit